MSEMVDRLAKRLTRLLGEDPTRWERNVSVVKILLEEMRIPTDKMLSVGRHGPAGDVPYDRDAEIVWTDMIDEALK